MPPEDATSKKEKLMAYCSCDGSGRLMVGSQEIECPCSPRPLRDQADVPRWGQTRKRDQPPAPPKKKRK